MSHLGAVKVCDSTVAEIFRALLESTREELVSIGTLDGKNIQMDPEKQGKTGKTEAHGKTGKTEKNRTTSFTKHD